VRKHKKGCYRGKESQTGTTGKKSPPTCGAAVAIRFLKNNRQVGQKGYLEPGVKIIQTLPQKEKSMLSRGRNSMGV